MLIGPLHVFHAISLLGGRENTVKKMPAMIFHQPADASGFNNVDSMAEDGHELRVIFVTAKYQNTNSRFFS